MSQNPLIDVLEANRLLRSPDEVTRFEQTLEKLVQNPDLADLPSLHLILDDACEQPEVMFSLVHFLESFDVEEQVQAFVQVLPDLVKRAEEWAAILHSRIMNDEGARSMLEEMVASTPLAQRSEIYELVSGFLKSEIATKLTTHISEISDVISKYGYEREFSISLEITPEKDVLEIDKKEKTFTERLCLRTIPDPPYLVLEEC
jgi:hypothetical protein